ncbi:MAG: LPS export ABC transporter periplasmic protein LptC [Candidatus Eremiobacteraeota bacterium]|nr:LPS export ABC transporter periplasmic protein LptC [Candidatus Eremiobacteraeota bacterium]
MMKQKFLILCATLALGTVSPAGAAPHNKQQPPPPPTAQPGTPKPGARASEGAKPTAAPEAARLDTGAYTVEGENLTWNQRTGEFSIPSHVKFTQPGTDVTGDKAVGNSLQKKVTITGNVVLHNNKPLATIGITSRGNSSEPQTLTANELQVNGTAKVYVATGNVKFLQGSRTVTAERGQLDQMNHMLDLSGDVHINDAATGQSMTAENVTYDTANETVTASGKPFQLRSVLTPAPAPAQTLAPPKKKKR